MLEEAVLALLPRHRAPVHRVVAQRHLLARAHVPRRDQQRGLVHVKPEIFLLECRYFIIISLLDVGPEGVGVAAVVGEGDGGVEAGPDHLPLVLRLHHRQLSHRLAVETLTMTNSFIDICIVTALSKYLDESFD